MWQLLLIDNISILNYKIQKVLCYYCLLSITSAVVTLNNVFTKGTEGAICQPPSYERGLVPMVTYENLFAFVIMLCAVITLVVYIIRKK